MTRRRHIRDEGIESELICDIDCDEYLEDTESEEEEESIEKWENEWQNTTKGEQTKRYFPTVAQRLKQRIPLTSKLTKMVTGHGILKAY
jgi:hypothetical protein